MEIKIEVSDSVYRGERQGKLRDVETLCNWTVVLVKALTSTFRDRYSVPRVNCLLITRRTVNIAKGNASITKARLALFFSPPCFIRDTLAGPFHGGVSFRALHRLSSLLSLSSSSRRGFNVEAPAYALRYFFYSRRSGVVVTPLTFRAIARSELTISLIRSYTGNCSVIKIISYPFRLASVSAEDTELSGLVMQFELSMKFTENCRAYPAGINPLTDRLIPSLLSEIDYSISLFHGKKTRLLWLFLDHRIIETFTMQFRFAR